MSLDLFNNLSNGDKKHNFIQNFIEEMSNYLEKNNSETTDKENDLRKEDCLYQVVEIGPDYAYLQNVDTNKVSKETTVSKELLDKIGNDSVLRYKNGEYLYEEGLTRRIF